MFFEYLVKVLDSMELPLKASMRGNYQEVENFLNSGGDVNIKDKKGRTILTYAAYNGHKLIVDLLLYHGADPNIKDKSGKTAYTHALDMGYSFDNLKGEIMKA